MRFKIPQNIIIFSTVASLVVSDLEAQPKPDFEFRQLSSNLGIYFEQTAMVSLYQTEYKLVVNLNLTKLYEEFEK